MPYSNVMRQTQSTTITLPRSVEVLKELRHDILSHFFDSLNYDKSARKPKNNGLLKLRRKKQRIYSKAKGTTTAENGEDWNGLEMTILKSLVIFFKIHER